MLHELGILRGHNPSGCGVRWVVLSFAGPIGEMLLKQPQIGAASTRQDQALLALGAREMLRISLLGTKASLLCQYASCFATR